LMMASIFFIAGPSSQPPGLDRHGNQRFAGPVPSLGLLKRHGVGMS
jgi:hypothetical protein